MLRIGINCTVRLYICYCFLSLAQVIHHLTTAISCIMSKYEDLVLLVDTPSVSQHDVTEMRNIGLVSVLL